MSETTPGRAAYEAHCATIGLTGDGYAWNRIDRPARERWAAIEQAVIEAHRSAPELAAAMAETRQLRDLTAEILAAFGPSGSGHTARVGQVQHRKWRERAGLDAAHGTERAGE